MKMTLEAENCPKLYNNTVRNTYKLENIFFN